MKRIIALLMTLALCLSLAAASADPLAEQAAAIGASMRRLAASVSYVTLLTGSGPLAERCAELGWGDTEPASVQCYAFELDRASCQSYVQDELGDAAKSMTEEQLDMVTNRLCTAFVSMLNASRGAEDLAAAAALTCSRAVAVDEMPVRCFYVLEYAAGSPIIVTVTPGEGAVSMTGTFLLVEDWQSLLTELVPFALKKIEIE